MSAPTLNAAPPTSTGPATGIGAAAQAAAQATGPLAGFEALLAAFFGAQGDPAVAGQAGKAGTTKPGAGLGTPPTDGQEAQGDPTAAATTGDPGGATDAAAAAAAACNAALILPIAAQPIADTPASGEATEVAAQATASGKPFTPTFAEAATDTAIDADGVAGADPNASPATTAAKLDPSVATQLKTPEPTKLVAPQTTTAPAPGPTGPPPETPVETPVAAPAVVAEALAAPQAAAAEARPAGQAASTTSTAPKDKAPAAKAGRGEHARIDIAAPGAAKPTSAAMTMTDAAATAIDGEDAVHAAAPRTAGAETKAEAPEAPAPSADAGAATASTTNASTQVHPGAIPVRGAPQTVANLAAEIAKKLEGRSTRFDLQLDPAGLGRVDVRMEIGASGRMTAAMTFDTPQAAAELRARAAELQRHLEQAGFDMSGGLSFDVAGDRGQGRQAQQNQDNDSGQAFRGRAFQQALATAGQADQSAASGALNLRRSLRSGVDIRI